MNRILILLMLGLASMQSSTGCPTCLGRLELQSPTFFSEELYQLDPEDDVESVYAPNQASDRRSLELPTSSRLRRTGWQDRTPDKIRGAEREKMNENMPDEGGKQ
jgi:hypothetical protein